MNFSMVSPEFRIQPHHHVVTYLSQEGLEPNRIFYTIEAYGQDREFEPEQDNQTRQRPRTEAYLRTACTTDGHDPPHYYEGRVVKQF